MNRTIQTIGSSIKQEFDISMYNHIEYYDDGKIDDDFHDIYKILINTIHFSFNTIKEIKKKYKDEKLFFIIGSDQFLNFETWHKPDEIKSLVNLVVPIRPPYIVNTQKWILENRKSYQSKVYKKTVFLKNFSEKMIIFYDLEKKIEISSFEIKKLLVEKKYSEAKQFLPQGVFEYILDNNLYIL